MRKVWKGLVAVGNRQSRGLIREGKLAMEDLREEELCLDNQMVGTISMQGHFGAYSDVHAKKRKRDISSLA